MTNWAIDLKPRPASPVEIGGWHPGALLLIALFFYGVLWALYGCFVR